MIALKKMNVKIGKSAYRLQAGCVIPDNIISFWKSTGELESLKNNKIIAENKEKYESYLDEIAKAKLELKKKSQEIEKKRASEKKLKKKNAIKELQKNDSSNEPKEEQKENEGKK